MRNNLLFLMFAMSTLAFTQADKSSCPANLSIFAEFAKVKNYDSAYQPWKEVLELCPELNVATFKYGERILEHKIENATAAPRKVQIDGPLIERGSTRRKKG